MIVQAYCPGDGTIKFRWMHRNKVVNNPVDLGFVQTWLKQHKSNSLKTGWRAVEINGVPQLVGIISRLDVDRLKVRDQVLTYDVDPNFLKDIDGHVSDPFLQLFAGEKRIVNNNLRGQVRHFLNNEKELAPTL